MVEGGWDAVGLWTDAFVPETLGAEDCLTWTVFRVDRVALVAFSVAGVFVASGLGATRAALMLVATCRGNVFVAEGLVAEGGAEDGA